MAAHLAWFLAGLVSCVPAGKPREGSRPLTHSRGLTQRSEQVADGSEIDPCCILDSFLPLVFVCMVVMVDLQSCKKLCFHRNNSDLLLLKKGRAEGKRRGLEGEKQVVSPYMYTERTEPHPPSRQLPVCHCQLPLQGEQKCFRY